ncbi:signal peptidase complex [Grosmannia clavigera kw1407]|uniref:Signal peptidase complex subunit 2 n=1 Tax=Grosmannia clavigera (strain kw1407 / UAMH 11150) TaxID=655863 RepID=F0XRQ4_GROCL|nr:signal peptidase complex [Grosmannia clavigera kw1407]EFW99621.1 signal peptidase complex [Grosmannia clavigera kw1407]
MAQEKISVYNLADLRNTSDDAIPNYLNSLGFVQSHCLTDVRLALGYGAFSVAGACFYWDWKLGFEDTKYYSAAAVLVYMALHAALSLWAKFVEKSTIYVGKSPVNNEIPLLTYQVSISTAADKFTPIYNVTVTTRTASKGAQPQTTQFSRAFSEWFDGAGRFVALPFQVMFASQVAAIGRVDSKRASAPQADASVAYDDETLTLLAAASKTGAVDQEDADVDGKIAVATGNSSSSGQKKASKRRKA